MPVLGPGAKICLIWHCPESWRILSLRWRSFTRSNTTEGSWAGHITGQRERSFWEFTNIFVSIHLFKYYIVHTVFFNSYFIIYFTNHLIQLFFIVLVFPVLEFKTLIFRFLSTIKLENSTLKWLPTKWPFCSVGTIESMRSCHSRQFVSRPNFPKSNWRGVFWSV